MKTMIKIFITALTLSVAAGAYAEAQPTAEQEAAARKAAQQQAKAQHKKEMLQRIYNMRMRFEQERAQAEAQARNNVRLQTAQNYRHMDSPTVTGLRAQTNQQLTRFEQMFKCLDVDVDAQGGNTVVICGDNSGDITGTNSTAGRDLVNIEGDRR